MTLKRSTALARWIFIAAAVYGIAVLGSMFFVTPRMLGRAAYQQPEVYYGFASLGLAWQIVFLLIGTNPRRYRPIMLIAAVGEKFLFAAILMVLMLRHIAGLHWIGPACIDLLLDCAFVIAYSITPDQ